MKLILASSSPRRAEILRDAGLSSLTGGGAEIFDPVVRDQICRGKESAEEWLEVHRTWHQMGERSTCTMLYGHVETTAHRIDHLRRLRELQDETQGFTALVPFAFEPQHNRLTHLGMPEDSSYGARKHIEAQSRRRQGSPRPPRR